MNSKVKCILKIITRIITLGLSYLAERKEEKNA